jgi:carboxyl-terminal processing protease
MDNKTPIYITLALAGGLVLGSLLKGPGAGVFPANSKEAKIDRLIQYIEESYVDNVDVDDLLDGAVEEMLSKLDPHSVYISRDEIAQVRENMEGQFVGIGVQFQVRQDTIVVSRPIEGGPSYAAGIKSGDRILVADQDTLYGRDLSSDDIVGKLKGAPDSHVMLQVYRKATNEYFDFDITRGSIPIKSVPAAFMLTPDVGYVKLERFARTSAQEFREALQFLQSRGMQSLVFDLRGNPGGFIGIATQIVDEFLGEDKMIVYTRDNAGRVEEEFATNYGMMEDRQVYVLMDENSASASEIVAGALQDNDQGVIVGRRSFGKGLVQQEMDLGDGSAVRLTIARYYTPTGRSIQKPYGDGAQVAYEDDYLARLNSGELFSRDSIKVVDSLRYETPNGKVVYGGGGIVPDVFVGIDTLRNRKVNSVYRPNVHNHVFSYVDNNRFELENWDLDTFVLTYEVPDEVLGDFKKANSMKLSREEDEVLAYYMKSLVAQHLFDELGYFRMEMREDAMIKKVLELEKEAGKDVLPL